MGVQVGHRDLSSCSDWIPQSHPDCPAAPACCSRPTGQSGLRKSTHCSLVLTAPVRSGTHQVLQAVKRVKTGLLSFRPLGSLQLESQDPNLLSYLLSPHSVPFGTRETQQVTHGRDFFLQCIVKHQKTTSAS